MSGFIKVHRTTFSHELFEGDPFSRRDAWLWLIANAAWKPHRTRHRKKLIPIDRGQLPGARKHLATVWGWGEQRVRTFLSELECEGMVTLASNQQLTIISICNYDTYQSGEKSSNQQLTSFQPASNHTEEGKEVKEEDINTPLTHHLEPARAKTGMPREGESDQGHGVFLNCETIRHQYFLISIPGLEMAFSGAIDRETLKTKALAHALQWAAEIENGKSPRDVVPAKVSNFLVASLKGEINREQCADIRRERTAKRYGDPAASLKSFSSYQADIGTGQPVMEDW